MLTFIQLALASHLATVSIEPRVEPKTAPHATEDIKSMISLYADRYHVSSQVLTKIVECESSFNTDATNSNQWEFSRGLVQINLLTHPEVTEEQATNPSFALDFLAKNVAKGKGKMWSCYSIVNK